VFAATLVRRDEPGGLIRSSTDPVALTWTVDAVYKGSAGTVQQVVTADSSASCGLEVEVGKRYLVHADAVDGKLEASLCGGTRPLAGNAGEAADQLSVAGRAGEPPAAAPERQRESDSTRWWPFAVGGGFAGLALAFWIVRRRTRGAEGTPAAGAV